LPEIPLKVSMLGEEIPFLQLLMEKRQKVVLVDGLPRVQNNLDSVKVKEIAEQMLT